MDFWQEIFMALSRNKLRTFLTGFAISWGIFILIVLLAAGNGLMDAVGEQFSSRSTNTYSLYVVLDNGWGIAVYSHPGEHTEDNIWGNVGFVTTAPEEAE